MKEEVDLENGMEEKYVLSDIGLSDDSSHDVGAFEESMKVFL